MHFTNLHRIENDIDTDTCWLLACVWDSEPIISHCMSTLDEHSMQQLNCIFFFQKQFVNISMKTEQLCGSQLFSIKIKNMSNIFDVEMSKTYWISSICYANMDTELDTHHDKSQLSYVNIKRKCWTLTIYI